MVKSERMEVERVEPTPGSAWLIGLAAWFVPGIGHLLLHKWGRAALMGGAVWVCFFVGLALGGHLFYVSMEGATSFLQWSVVIQVPPMVADLGAGILYIGCWLFDVGFREDPAQAARATYEYGTTFLLIAGLLNYLTMLDAFDIAVGRKS
ncbi:MAG TPA: DUF6677 family protein [Pyrinomonadaceae bacterium]|nr:DUF6677 family protein [Pyrinomonadaceae bacterium]